jgi:hypothetical protein
LEGMCWEIGLAGVELAPLVGAYDLIGVSNHGGLVEGLAERITHEGTRRRVVATHASVDVSGELMPLGDGNAPLQDVGRGALVQLAVDNGKRLGHPGDVPSLGPI